MEVIKIKPNTIFLLETNGMLPELQQESIFKLWNSVLPSTKLLIVPKGAIKILEADDGLES